MWIIFLENVKNGFELILWLKKGGWSYTRRGLVRGILRYVYIRTSFFFHKIFPKQEKGARHAHDSLRNSSWWNLKTSHCALHCCNPFRNLISLGDTPSFFASVDPDIVRWVSSPNGSRVGLRTFSISWQVVVCEVSSLVVLYCARIRPVKPYTTKAGCELETALLEASLAERGQSGLFQFKQRISIIIIKAAHPSKRQARIGSRAAKTVPTSTDHSAN